MKTYIALFRGINVGGRNRLPMKDLRAILEMLGCENVQTYIQSGNVVFDSAVSAAALPEKITRAVDEKFGFAPAVLLIDAKKLRLIAAQNPFRDIVDEPRFLHIWFLAEPSRNPDFDKLNEFKADSERYDLSKDAFYLYAPEGIARSKLAAAVDRLLGVLSTSRNLNTVTKLLQLIDTAR